MSVCFVNSNSKSITTQQQQKPTHIAKPNNKQIYINKCAKYQGPWFLYIDIVYITDGLLFAVWLLCAYGGGDDDERRAKQRVSIYITKALLYMVSDVSKLCGLDLHWRRDES